MGTCLEDVPGLLFKAMVYLDRLAKVQILRKASKPCLALFLAGFCGLSWQPATKYQTAAPIQWDGKEKGQKLKLGG